MKLTKSTSSEKKAKKQLAPVNERVKSSIMMPPHKLAGPGFIVVKSKGSTRWERLKNIVLFAWRYVWHGIARL